MSELFEFVKQGDYTSVDHVILKGSSPNVVDDDGRTPLHWAAQEGQLKIAGRLIAAGAEVNPQDKHGFTPLAVAVGEAHEALVRTLLDAGASPNLTIASDSDGTPLHLACSWNRLEIAKALVERAGTDINARTVEGKTPLAYALDGQFEELSKYLIAHGAIA